MAKFRTTSQLRWQDALATWLAADQAERLLQDFRVPRAVYKRPNVYNTCNNKLVKIL